MKRRSPIAVVLLTLITFGIYGIYWEVTTKIEMTKRGADIPTAWLIIIPIVQWWWLYKYCVGVEQVTKGKMSAVLSLVLMLFLSVIGMAIIQDAFNKVVDEPGNPQPQSPIAPVGPQPPTNTGQPIVG